MASKSRYNSAATTAVEEEVEEYEYAPVGGQRVDRDFMRRNISQFHSIQSSLQRRFSQPSYRSRDCSLLQPHYSSMINMPFPPSSLNNPAEGICTHFLRRGFTKPVKFQLNTAVWSADGRWLVLGTQSGDFALWEGEALKVHKVVSVPAHKVLADGGKVQDYVPITAMAWNHHGNTLVSGDNNGVMQYCDESFRSNYVIREAHTGAVRGLAYSPLDSKLASCSDDSLVKLWAVGRDTPELTLSGHQSDIRCIDWHPFKSLIATGSRESVIKLWDPKQGSCVANINSHKKSILCCQWNQNGNWLATGSKDAMVKIYDIRMMKEMESLRGHNCDVCSLQWHPVHESLLLSGGYNGSLIYWIAGHNQSAHTAIADAHRQSIDVIAWHPGGHLVTTASHDCILKFWCREPPGSRIDTPPQYEFVESQPPVYGYGPLKPGMPAVVLQSSSNSQTAAATSQAAAPSSSFQSRGGNNRFNNGQRSNTSRPGNRSSYQPQSQGQFNRKRPRDGF